MTKKQPQFPKKYRCQVSFDFWRGKIIRQGEIIEVSSKDFRNKALKKKLKERYMLLEIATIVSEPIAILNSKPEKAIGKVNKQKQVEEN